MLEFLGGMAPFGLPGYVYGNNHEFNVELFQTTSLI